MFSLICFFPSSAFTLLCPRFPHCTIVVPPLQNSMRFLIKAAKCLSQFSVKKLVPLKLSNNVLLAQYFIIIFATEQTHLGIKV